MKLIYVILLFMMFFNIFSFMLGDLDIFSYTIESDDSNYNLSDVDEKTEGGIFEDISGAGWGGVCLDRGHGAGQVWGLDQQGAAV